MREFGFVDSDGTPASSGLEVALRVRSPPKDQLLCRYRRHAELGDRLGPPITFRGWRCASGWSAQPLTRPPLLHAMAALARRRGSRKALMLLQSFQNPLNRSGASCV
jgi:hypothetical protein